MGIMSGTTTSIRAAPSVMAGWARFLPVRSMILLVAVWIILATINFSLIHLGLEPGTSTSFPISIFRGPKVRPIGLLFAGIFFVATIFALRRVRNSGPWCTWFVGLTLILLGNLAQGGLHEAFYHPFLASGIQYFQDATQIDNWRSWLASFNSHQEGLLTHTRTHPPFAVLLHLPFMGLAKSPLGPALAFVLISTLSIPLFHSILKMVGAKAAKASRIALLFSVLPACNIYFAVSLDGVIATTSILCLFGLLHLVYDRPGPGGTIALVAGFILTNLLTFAGLFLLGVGFATAVGEIAIFHRKRVAVAMLLCMACSYGLHILLLKGFGYHHGLAFTAAALIENPEGFMGFAYPLAFTMTRVEDVCEILLFLSFGVCAVLLQRGSQYNTSWRFLDAQGFVSLAGVCTLLAMLAVGAYRTGETARACLFIYPYLLLPLRKVRGKTLDALIATAGIQTAIMQSFGEYSW